MKTKNGTFKPNSNELVSYQKKGTKLLKTIRMSPIDFDDFFNYFKDLGILSQTTSFEVFNNASYGLWQKNLVLFYASAEQETQAYRIIVNSIFITENDFCEKKHPNVYKQCCNGCYDYILVSDDSCAQGEISKTWPSAVRKWGKNTIEKHYTKDEVQAIIDSCDETRADPLSFRAREYNDEAVKWEDCLYQDIHKAHNSELIKLFPKCKEFEQKYKDALYYKSIGNKEMAKKAKDYPNLLVGCFAQKYKADQGEHKEGQLVKWLYDLETIKIYNTIVNNIRAKINQHYKTIKGNGTLVYAQTDGLIISNPNWSKVIDSDELGEFGVEPIDNKVVWTYYQGGTATTTGYTIYQYFENGEKKVVGDLPDELKPLIDLSIGQVVHYKKEKIIGYKKYKNNLIDVYTTSTVRGE